MSRREGASFGCLGWLWLLAMALGTLLLAIALVWLDPAWLARVAFWKTPALPQETILVPISQEEAEVLEGGGTSREPGTRVWEAETVTARYSEAEGATLTTVEGTRVEFPPGSMGGEHSIELTPVIELSRAMSRPGLLPVGPFHDLRVDGQEHQSFDRPIRVSVPYDPTPLPGGLPEGRMAIATWERGRWLEHPTRLDPAQGMLVAELPRACVTGLVLLGLGAANLVMWTDSGQSIWKRLWDGLDQTHDTDHFRIRYATSGKHGVPSNVEYPLTGGRAQRGPPLYVQDLARHLEEARTLLPRVHLQLPGSSSKHIVFVMNLPDFGTSALGGPVIIDNDMRDREGFPAHLGHIMRRTCVHELIHVAQDAFFGSATAGGYRWWLESTAEYLSTKVLEDVGSPEPDPYYYIQSRIALPATPLDKSTGGQMYAYARFFAWLAERGVDMPQVIAHINRGGKPSLTALALGIRRTGHDMRLGFAFEEFAREMYHDNMWTGRLTSTQQISSSVAQLDPGFGPVAYPKNRQAIVVPYAERRLQLPLLSAKLFHFWAQTLPAERQGHLVVSVEAAEASSTVSAVTAEARGRTLPPVGSPSTLTPLSLIQGKHVTKGLFASPGAAPDDVNRVSLILVNRSPVVQAPTITVRRWLLMPPAWVQFSRRDEGGYRISWPESELKQAGGGVAFGGYHVYRRRFGQAEFPDRPLNAQAILAESYTDAEAAKGFFEYTVRVRDSLDNLSEPAPLAMEGEPFEGVWSGWLSVTKGNLTTLAMRWLDAELAKASLGGGQVQAAKAHVRVLVGALDMLLRFGIPMTWQVERVKDQYMVRPLTVLGQPVEDSETLQLRRLGRYTIGLLPTTPRGRPIILSLSGKDQIRRRFEGTMRDPDLGVMEFGVRIVFDRAQ